MVESAAGPGARKIYQPARFSLQNSLKMSETVIKILDHLFVRALLR